MYSLFLNKRDLLSHTFNLTVPLLPRHEKLQAIGGQVIHDIIQASSFNSNKLSFEKFDEMSNTLNGIFIKNQSFVEQLSKYINFDNYDS